MDSTLGIGTLTGFENHAGQSKFVEKLQPLGIVKQGIGNHLSESCDGAVTDQIIATYMHGPALVRNPNFLLKNKSASFGLRTSAGPCMYVAII